MLIDAHVHIFPNVNGYGPKGHTHGEGYGRIDAGDGIAQDVLPAINEKTSHTLQMLLHEMRQGQVDKAVLILCPCYGDWSEYVLQACRDYPEQFTASAFFDPWRPAARQYYTEKLEGPLWKNIKIEFSEAGGLYGVYPGVQLDAPELVPRIGAVDTGCLHHLGGNGRQARGKQHDVVSAEPPGGHCRQHEIDNCRVAEPLADPAGKPQPRQDLVERAVHRGEEIGKRIGHSHAVDDKRKKRDGLYQLCALKAAVQHHGDSKLDGDHHHVHGQIDKVVAQGKPQVRRLCEHFDVIAYPVERPLRRNAVPACKAHGHQIHRRVDHEYQQQDHRHHERQNNKAVPAFVDGLHTAALLNDFGCSKARKKRPGPEGPG